MAFRIADDIVSYKEIGQFIEQTGLSAQTNNKYAWFGIDAVQGGLHNTDEYSVHLFQQKFTIPIVTWTKVFISSIVVTFFEVGLQNVIPFSAPKQ